MSAFAFLFDWYNLPFTIALGCSLLLAILQLASGFGEGEGDADADADVDADADADVGADADADADAGGGILDALGVGRIPLMIVLLALLGSLGAVGLLANSLIGAALGGYPGLAFPVVLVGGGLLALLITRLISAGLARLAPRSSVAVGNADLVGRAGVVVSPSVSATYGRVVVRDKHGTSHTVFAVIERGEPIPEQHEVALVSYDEAQRRFVVRALR